MFVTRCLFVVQPVSVNIRIILISSRFLKSYIHKSISEFESVTGFYNNMNFICDTIIVYVFLFSLDFGSCRVFGCAWMHSPCCARITCARITIYHSNIIHYIFTNLRSMHIRICVLWCTPGTHIFIGVYRLSCLIEYTNNMLFAHCF